MQLKQQKLLPAASARPRVDYSRWVGRVGLSASCRVTARSDYITKLSVSVTLTLNPNRNPAYPTNRTESYVLTV